MKEFGWSGPERGNVAKTAMAVAAKMLDYYEEALQDETDPMGEVDLPGGEDQDPNMDGADKAKLRQLETIFKSMDPETQEVATQLLNMVKGEEKPPFE